MLFHDTKTLQGNRIKCLKRFKAKKATPCETKCRKYTPEQIGTRRDLERPDGRSVRSGAKFTTLFYCFSGINSKWQATCQSGAVCF